jgi:hypothetical protein
MKKKIIAVIALVLVVAAIIIAGVKLTQHRKVTNEYTEPTAPADAASLYGDANPDVDDNIDILSDGNAMLEKIQAALEGTKDAGYSETSLTLKEEKTDKTIRFAVLSDNAETGIYFVFSESGPSVLTESTKDETLYQLCCTILLQTCTPSMGDYSQCETVFQQMEAALSDGSSAVTYTQNYTEYTYTSSKDGKQLSARETTVVG